MLKLVKNHNDEDMIELQGATLEGDAIVWTVFDQDALFGEDGNLRIRLVDSEVEVVIISREEYNKLKGDV